MFFCLLPLKGYMGFPMLPLDLAGFALQESFLAILTVPPYVLLASSVPLPRYTFWFRHRYALIYNALLSIGYLLSYGVNIWAENSYFRSKNLQILGKLPNWLRNVDVTPKWHISGPNYVDWYIICGGRTRGIVCVRAREVKNGKN